MPSPPLLRADGLGQRRVRPRTRGDFGLPRKDRREEWGPFSSSSSPFLLLSDRLTVRRRRRGGGRAKEASTSSSEKRPLQRREEGREGDCSLVSALLLKEGRWAFWCSDGSRWVGRSVGRPGDRFVWVFGGAVGGSPPHLDGRARVLGAQEAGWIPLMYARWYWNSLRRPHVCGLSIHS